jgi:YD repeat-containing protein
VPVARYRYDADFDGSADGDDAGRLTAVETLRAVTTLAGGDGDWVRPQYAYDSFGRQNAVIAPDPDGDGPLLATRTEHLYDSSGRPTFTKTWTVEATPRLLAQSENVYTGVYLTEVRQYAVDPDTGTPGDCLATKNAYGDYGGAVNRPADAGPDSPSVHYAYDPLGRLTAVTYPNGRVVGYEYGAAGSVDDRLSRVAVISDGTGPNAPHLADYAYLGASTIVRETFPQPAVRLNHADANGAVNRLDRFGRAVDQVWEHYDELGVTDAIRDFFAYDSLTPGAKRIPARSPLPVSVVALAT